MILIDCDICGENILSSAKESDMRGMYSSPVPDNELLNVLFVHICKKCGTASEFIDIKNIVKNAVLHSARMAKDESGA